jgi:hypothetical protein
MRINEKAHPVLYVGAVIGAMIGAVKLAELAPKAPITIPAQNNVSKERCPKQQKMDLSETMEIQNKAWRAQLEVIDTNREKKATISLTKYPFYGLVEKKQVTIHPDGKVDFWTGSEISWEGPLVKYQESLSLSVCGAANKSAQDKLRQFALEVRLSSVNYSSTGPIALICQPELRELVGQYF